MLLGCLGSLKSKILTRNNSTSSVAYEPTWYLTVACVVVYDITTASYSVVNIHVNMFSQNSINNSINWQQPLLLSQQSFTSNQHDQENMSQTSYTNQQYHDMLLSI